MRSELNHEGKDEAFIDCENDFLFEVYNLHNKIGAVHNQPVITFWKMVAS